MTLQQGWEAIAARRLDAAHQHFNQALQQHNRPAEALRGLARTAMLHNQLDDAEQLINRAHGLEQSPHTILVKALILGERGQRANAYKQMLALKLLMPNDGFLLAAMAEQRIRQGYWDEGTTLFIQSLQHDPHGLAFAHIREVICDMSEAIASGRLPAVDPVKMLNRIDHSSPQYTSAFFANARRLINQGQVVPREPGPAPVTSQPTPQPRTLAPTPATTPQTHTASSTHTPRTTSQAYSQKPLRPARPAARSAFIDSMNEERTLNAQLQQHIEALPSFEWPSQQDSPIDDIPTIASTMKPTTRLGDEQINSFRVSQGDIFVQLYMERCFETFTRTIPTELTGGIVLDPSLFTFLDLNLLDGTLTLDFEVMTSDLSELELADHAASAFAYFLGESMVKTYNGTWSYHDHAARAEVHIESQSINPYALAKQWLDDPKRDPGPIYQLLEHLDIDAQEAEHHGYSAHEYIDPTADATDQELISKIAELWAFYCIRHARTPVPEIARQIKVVKDLGPVVIIALEQGLSPTPPQPHAAFHPKTGRLFYAYRRLTGEFLMLGRPSGLAHVLAETHGALTSDNAGEVVRFISTYHIPGGVLVESDEVANTRFPGVGVLGPKLQRRSENHLVLSVWVIRGKEPHELTFSCVNTPHGAVWRYEP